MPIGSPFGHCRRGLPRRQQANWQWVFGCATAVRHVIAQSRGKAVVVGFLAGARPKVWISDRLAAQAGHAEQHQVCLDHLIRDAQYAIDDGDIIFAPGFKGLLKRACAIGRRRDTLLDATLAAHRRDLDRRLDRLMATCPNRPAGMKLKWAIAAGPSCSCSSRSVMFRLPTMSRSARCDRP